MVLSTHCVKDQFFSSYAGEREMSEVDEMAYSENNYLSLKSPTEIRVPSLNFLFLYQASRYQDIQIEITQA